MKLKMRILSIIVLFIVAFSFINVLLVTNLWEPKTIQDLNPLEENSQKLVVSTPRSFLGKIQRFFSPDEIPNKKEEIPIDFKDLKLLRFNPSKSELDGTLGHRVHKNVYKGSL